MVRARYLLTLNPVSRSGCRFAAALGFCLVFPPLPSQRLFFLPFLKTIANRVLLPINIFILDNKTRLGLDIVS